MEKNEQFSTTRYAAKLEAIHRALKQHGRTRLDKRGVCVDDQSRALEGKKR